MGERYTKWLAKRLNDPCINCEFKEKPYLYPDSRYPRIHIIDSCVEVLGEEAGKLRHALCLGRAAASQDPEGFARLYIEYFELRSEQAEHRDEA